MSNSDFVSKEMIINSIKEKTADKIFNFPISVEAIPDVVLDSWKDIFTISDSKGDFRIGINSFPKPQMMGFFLESLIARSFEKLDPKTWVLDPTGYAKDVTNLKNDELSVEIKTSSSKKHIFGNRSYANPGAKSKKGKDSFYLAINFDKFDKSDIVSGKLTKRPEVTLIRFGYLVHSDWIGQAAQSGQSATLSLETEEGKLLELWPNQDPILRSLKRKK